MPGILTEPQVKSEEEGEVVDYCNGSSKTVAPVAGDCTTSPSPTPSRSPDPGENGKTHSTSDSDVNLNRSGHVSSASESDATCLKVKDRESGATSDGGGVALSEVGGGKEGKLVAGDSAVYNIHLSLPGVPQPVDVMLTSRDTVHDLLQFSLERPECCYRTALAVYHNGKKLDDFHEIGSIESLQDGDTMDVVEESYAQRDVRLHVQRLKDLLSTNPLQQSLSSSDGLSLSFLSSIAKLDPEDCISRDNDMSQLEPPSYCMPRLSEPADSPPVPLSVFYPPNLEKHFKFPECLKSLVCSSWNPPPSKRKMKGDLLYLEVTTLEGQDYYITATPSGFFLNKSTSQENFDPTPRKTPHLHKHLVGLLSQISPLFKKNFAQLHKYGDTLQAYEILPVPYPVMSWVVPMPQHTPTHFRIDDTMSLRAHPDELMLGQMRDWNDELQTAKELSTTTSSAKVFRDRALFKIHSEFVQACTRGAQAVVEGYLPPLNPGEEPKFRMYLWNSIFFSFAFDGRDHYKEFGGDNAAHAAASADLQGVASFEKMDPKDLYTLGTTLVDYCGCRVVCQTIIPGLLQREHDSAVVYGSIDTGRNVSTEERFAELLKKIGDQLHIREHKVYTEKKDGVVSLPSSLEVKGIIGNDKRYYVLDLIRIFPPDANYMGTTGGKSRHKMAILRPEFLDTFLSFKFMLFLRLIKEKTDALKQLQALQGTPTTEPKGQDEPTTESKGQDPTSESKGQDPTSESKGQDPTSESKGQDELSSESGGQGTPITKGQDEPSSESKGQDEPSSESKGQEGQKAQQEASPISFDMALNTKVANSASPCDTAMTILVPSGEATPTINPHDVIYIANTAADAFFMPETQSEEKEVGPDIPCGLADEDLSAMRQTAVLMEGDTLTQQLKTGDLNSVPEVDSAFCEALKQAGSSSLEEFVINFNVDIMAPLARHADDPHMLKQDEQLVEDAGVFLVGSVVPRFVHDCIQLVVTPMDGEGLTSAMHARGINMRYLGQVATLASLRDDLKHLKRLCLGEMVGRLAKRRMRKLLQETPLEVTSEAITHFLNCYLSPVKDEVKSSLPNGHGQVRRKRNKKKVPHGKVSAHLRLNSESLWSEIVDEMKWYYKFDMKYSSLSEMCLETGVRKMALLRQLCKKTGVQLLLKDYDFTCHPVFTDDDIAALCPVVKHTNFRPAEPTTLYEMALSKFSAGQIQLSHELFVNTLHMFVQVYGPMHLDTANCYRHMARIEYILGDFPRAMSSQYKATLILERVLGVDHPETLSAYINLALYCQTNNQPAPALRLLYRARYLLLLMYGEDHPEMSTCDSNIAIILNSIKDFQNSHKFLTNALLIQNRYHGVESLQAALTHHLLARVQSFMGDFRAALVHEKKCYSIYQKKLGVNHDRTKESSLCLKDLTEKAVTMQKTINEITGKGESGGGGGGKVLTELPGSWGEVVGMMNGIELRQQIKQKPHGTRKKKRGTKNTTTPSGGSEWPVFQ